jgi:hypothetical protein
VDTENGAIIDGVSLALLMALIYALDVSILQRKEEQDGEFFYTYFLYLIALYYLKVLYNI